MKENRHNRSFIFQIVLNQHTRLPSLLLFSTFALISRREKKAFLLLFQFHIFVVEIHQSTMKTKQNNSLFTVNRPK